MPRKRRHRSAPAFDPARLKELMVAKGYGISRLAEACRIAPVTLRRWRDGKTEPHWSTLQILAGALGVDWRELADPSAVDPSDGLERAIELDQAGNSPAAIGLCERLRDSVPPSNPILYDIMVRLATFHDHSGEFEKAIGLLNKLIDCPPPLAAACVQKVSWAYYQRGVVRRRMIEDLLVRNGWRRNATIRRGLRLVESDLMNMGTKTEVSKNPAHQHQMGVLRLLGGDVKRALGLFKRAERLRRSIPRPDQGSADFRIGFEIRRQGQCHAHLGDFRAAAKCFSEARVIAISSKHKRLEDDVARDCIAFGIQGTAEMAGAFK